MGFQGGVLCEVSFSILHEMQLSFLPSLIIVFFNGETTIKLHGKPLVLQNVRLKI